MKSACFQLTYLHFTFVHSKVERSRSFATYYNSLSGSSTPWMITISCVVSPQGNSRTTASKSRQTSGDRVCVLQVAAVWQQRLRRRLSSSENVRLEVAAPTTWNTLSDSVKEVSSIDVFKSRLKTYLFGLSYGETEFFNNVLLMRPCITNCSCIRAI